MHDSTAEGSEWSANPPRCVELSGPRTLPHQYARQYAEGSEWSANPPGCGELSGPRPLPHGRERVGGQLTEQQADRKREKGEIERV